MKYREATFERSGRGGRFGEIFRPKHFAEPTTPSAPLRWLRDFLLLAQPPLLPKELIVGKKERVENQNVELCAQVV